MPHSNKPVLAILYSSDISEIDFSKFIDTNKIGQIIVDSYESPLYYDLKSFCKQNNIECIPWKENPLGEQILYEEMINFSDKAIFFWSLKPDNIAAAAYYAAELGIDMKFHAIEL